jgi:hypothetical protein
MHIYYRISDTGYKKIKPSYINNRLCFNNFCQVFQKHLANIIVIGDNIGIETLEMLSEHINESNIRFTSIGHGAGTFNIALDESLKLSEDEIIYFVENDYLHKNFSADILLDGFTLNPSFVTLYDHPDKYLDPSLGGNQFCQGGSENTKVYITKSCHWKITNSTTMTFASKVSTLKKHEGTLRKWTQGSHPHDFQMFIELMQKEAFLISAIPGYATHGETAWLSPLTDWSQI